MSTATASAAASGMIATGGSVSDIGTIDKMIENVFARAAGNRERILSEWQKGYDSKSEPKC